MSNVKLNPKFSYTDEEIKLVRLFIRSYFDVYRTISKKTTTYSYKHMFERRTDLMGKHQYIDSATFAYCMELEGFRVISSDKEGLNYYANAKCNYKDKGYSITLSSIK